MNIYRTIFIVALCGVLLIFIAPKLINVLGTSYYKVWYESAVISTMKDNLIEECFK